MTVRMARAEEADVVTDLIAAAFVEIPPTAWLIPDGAVRREVFGPYLRIFVDSGMISGRIDVAVNGADQPVAAAIWWPSPVPEPEGYDKRLADAVGQEPLARFAVFDAGMHQIHPTEPHQYLGFAASWPDRQGQGHGTRLLEHRHAELDAAGEGAYLVAASEPARRLYQRLGYADHGEPMTLPDGPTMWPMWRAARRSGV